MRYYEPTHHAAFMDRLAPLLLWFVAFFAFVNFGKILVITLSLRGIWLMYGDSLFCWLMGISCWKVWTEHWNIWLITLFLRSFWRFLNFGVFFFEFIPRNAVGWVFSVKVKQTFLVCILTILLLMLLIFIIFTIANFTQIKSSFEVCIYYTIL